MFYEYEGQIVRLKPSWRPGFWYWICSGCGSRPELHPRIGLRGFHEVFVQEPKDDRGRWQDPFWAWRLARRMDAVCRTTRSLPA
jgi:hypothetical protein